MVNEIAGAYEVHPHQVATWKYEAQEGLKGLFERKRGRRTGRTKTRCMASLGGCKCR